MSRLAARLAHAAVLAGTLTSTTGRQAIEDTIQRLECSSTGGGTWGINSN